MAIVPVDPRRDRAEPADVRPIVGTARSGLPLWVMIAGLILAGILLFSILDARRRAASAPPVRARYDDAARASQPMPPLFIPPPAPVAPPTPSPTPASTPIPPPVVAPLPRIIYIPQPAPPAPAYQPPPPQRASNEPVLVIDTGTGAAPGSNAAGPVANAPTDVGEASSATVRATVIRNRATIVGQGTLIPAVLESALDSTRGGSVRALVSGDVRGFDGSRILIPRGSRLFGDYRADLQPGQNRALINWTRLVRPDGVAIAIGSPASDPLGRAGVRGKVNSHFLERFGAAILQSSLDIGVNLASRLGNNNSPVIVALPGTTQALAQPLTQGAQIRPTLRVRHGTALSVFVARDLDFTAVENYK